MKIKILNILLSLNLIFGLSLIFGYQDHTPVPKQKEIIQVVIDSLESIPPQPQFRELNWDDFIESMIWVESRGNDSIIGDNGKAVGCLQIHPIMVREVNRVLRKNKANNRYKLDDRYNRKKSIEMFEIMAEQTECCDDLSFFEFCEVVARKWNGGGRGHKKKSTLNYWRRVENKLCSIDLELSNI